MIHPHRRALCLLILLALAPLVSAAEPAREPRGKEWLVKYLTQPIPQAPRNARYIANINAHAKDYFRVDPLWFAQGEGDGLSPARSNLTRLARLTFCFRTKGLTYHADPKARELIRQSLVGIAMNITDDGAYAWGPAPGNHEQAWMVELSLLPFIWFEEFLTPDQRTLVRAALRRAADNMVAHPRHSTSNQAAVWASNVALASLYFDQPEWMALADRHADEYVFGGKGNIYDDGEIGEHHAGYGNGGGPDTNYTYTGLSGIYAYRLWSGRTDIDPLLMKAARWLVGYSALTGYSTVPGASARMLIPHTSGYRDAIPFYERLSRTDPFFARLADLALRKEERGGTVYAGHLVAAGIWGMLEAGAAPTDAPLPDWQINRTAFYGPPERRAISYALVSRVYQTGMTFTNFESHNGARDWPAKGLQTFAWGDEPPILLGTRQHLSGTAADGIDTGKDDVSTRPDGTWDVLVKTGARIDAERCDLATITTRRGTLWTLYAVAPKSLVVVYGGAEGELASRWVFSRAVVGEPTLDADARTATFGDRRARLLWLAGDARIAPTRQTRNLIVTAPAPLNAFAFTAPGFRFIDADARRLTFGDASGRYTLDLTDMLAPDGTLRRIADCRLSIAE